MNLRKLGNSGIEVAPLAFGGNVFGWTVDEPAAFKILDAFVAAGFNLIDTADVYSTWVPGHKGGESETMIGNWLKRSGNRKKVVLATKVGSRMGPRKKGLYNLCDRAEFEEHLEPVCRKAGLGVITYFSLASGFLTGKYRSKKDLAGRARADRVAGYLNERGLRIIAALDRVAEQKNSTPAAVALAWLIARPAVTAPIASATSLEQLRELIAAASLELDAASLDALNEASRPQ